MATYVALCMWECAVSRGYAPALTSRRKCTDAYEAVSEFRLLLQITPRASLLLREEGIGGWPVDDEDQLRRLEVEKCAMSPYKPL